MTSGSFLTFFELVMLCHWSTLINLYCLFSPCPAGAPWVSTCFCSTSVITAISSIHPSCIVCLLCAFFVPLHTFLLLCFGFKPFSTFCLWLKYFDSMASFSWPPGKYFCVGGGYSCTCMRLLTQKVVQRFGWNLPWGSALTQGSIEADLDADITEFLFFSLLSQGGSNKCEWIQEFYF